MARYIDADKLGHLMYENAMEKDTDLQRWDSGCWIRYKLFENVVKETPTEDVAPVIHAKWIKGRYCSNCECDDYDYCCRQPKYCPECGSKMEKTENV